MTKLPQPPPRTAIDTMHHQPPTVSIIEPQPDEFRDHLAPLAMWARVLRAQRRLESISQHLRLGRRAGRYSDLDFFILALSLCAVGCATWSQLDERLGDARRQSAAVFGRATMASMSANSRYLSRVEAPDIEHLSTWLLNANSPCTASQHQASRARDALGTSWALYDWDGSRLAIRVRALPEGYDLPTARRLADKLARPGYAGRKRGSHVATYSLVQHAGSTQWVGAGVFSGGAGHAQLVEHAISSVEQAIAHQQWPAQHTIVRCDGEMRSRCFVRRVTQTSLHYLVRFDRYQLLRRPEVWRRLQTQPWQDVEDSTSGPRRQACELGHFELAADIDPERCRVVVSRFRASHKRGAGYWRDGYVYELYLCDLDPHAWPAADVVWLYYGRAGFENQLCALYRFAPALLHVLSYNPAGQALALCAATWLWNLALEVGLELGGELDPAPTPQLRPQQDDQDDDDHHHNDHDGHDDHDDQDDHDGRDCYDGHPHDADGSPLPAQFELSASSGDELSPGSPPPPSPPASTATHLDTIRQFDWPQLLASRINLVRFDPDSLTVHCAGGQRLEFKGVRQQTGSAGQLARWRAAHRDCKSCSLRAACQGEGKAHTFRRELNVALPAGNAAPPASPRRPPVGAAPRPPTRAILHEPRTVDAGPWLSSPAWLRAAELRQVGLKALAAVRVGVLTRMATDSQPQPRPTRAQQIARRQRRRQTWGQRLRHNQLPAHVDVSIYLYGHDPLAKLRVDPQPP